MLTFAWWCLGALLFIWIGFPLLVALFASLRGRRAAALPAELPPVTFIIATREDAESVRARILDCLQLRYPADRLQVIVALDARDPRCECAELAGIDPRVTCVVGDAPGGKALALNAAVRAARTDLLLFTDTFQRYEPQAVEEFVRAFQDPTVTGVSGSLALAPHSGALIKAYWRGETWLREQEGRLSSSVGVVGPNWALRRAAWRPLPAGLILDDVYQPMRVVLDGGRIAFAREARAHEVRGPGARAEFRRKVRTQTGILQLVAWLPGLLDPRRNAIWPQFVAHKLLRLLSPYLLLGTAVGFLPTLVAVWRDAVPPSRQLEALALAVVVLLIPPFRRAILGLIEWGFMLQAALVVAVVNASRGEWDVWRR